MRALRKLKHIRVLGQGKRFLGMVFVHNEDQCRRCQRPGIICFFCSFFESQIVVAYTPNPSRASEVQILFQKKHLEELIHYWSQWLNTHDPVGLRGRPWFPVFHCWISAITQSVFRVGICNEDGSEVLAAEPLKREQFCHMERLVAWFPLRYLGFYINCQVKLGIKTQSE